MGIASWSSVQGAVALRTGGIYCAHIYSEASLTWAAVVVQELWRRRVYSGPGRAGSWRRVWMSARGLTGSSEMGSLHIAAGRDPGGGPGREAECL